MRLIYSVLMTLLTPFLLLRLWWKGRLIPAYRKRILERFSLAQGVYGPIDVWIHAVSLGEVIAATPLIEAFLEKQMAVLVTTMTPTGSDRVLSHFGGGVAHQYLPYDLPFVLKRFFKQVQPRVGVIMETELWPNLIYQSYAARVPLLLANARLSESSSKGYQRFRFLFKPLLPLFHAILAQSEADANRFIALGAKKESVHVFGNMKFDVQTNQIDSLMYRQLKQVWGGERVTVIAASTHEDEEKQILSCLRHLQAAIPSALLLIAPRHPERFQSVYQLAQRMGFKTGLRSVDGGGGSDREVIVLDSLGELLGFYQVSDYAFVGGSLVPVGGHNVLEPIAVAVPVLSGPHVYHFKAICAELTDAKGILVVQDATDLINSIIALDKDTNARQAQVNNAFAVLERNKGAVAKHFNQVEEILGAAFCQDSKTYKHEMGRSDVFHRTTIEETIAVLDHKQPELAQRIRIQLALPPIQKPGQHTGGSESDIFPLKLSRAEVDLIVEALGDAEVAALGPDYATTPEASRFVTLQGIWNQYKCLLDEN